jgi:hypothetical protein
VFFASFVAAAPPKLDGILPAGVQRGGSAVVTFSGDFPNWPPKVWVDRAGVTITPEKEKGKCRVEAAADATPGVAWVRAYDDTGASVLRPLMIGVLAEAVEAEPNDAPATAQTIPPRSVVDGKLAKANDVDAFRVKLARGETLVAAIEAQRLFGSPMDAVLQVCELRERQGSSVGPAKIEAFVLEQNHDAVGLDPLVACTAPRDGEYLVRLFAFPSEPNSNIGFSGAETYLYRLTITTGGFVHQTLPLAVSRNEATDVRLLGWNLPETILRVQIAPAASPAELFAVAFHPDAAGTVLLPRVELPSIVAEPGRTLDDPQAIAAPCVVSGLIDKPGGSTVFRVDAAKGKPLRLKVETQSLGSPLLPGLTIHDTDGKRVAESEGTKADRDFEFTFMPPADGAHRVTLRDLATTGGPRSVFRLTVAPPLADFSLTLAADTFTLPAGKTLEIPVAIDRQNGFDEAIDIQALDPPPGIVAEVVASQAKGESAKSVKLVLKRAEGNAEPLAGPLRIIGRSTGPRSLARPATFALPAPLPGRHTAAWLTAPK